MRETPSIAFPPAGTGRRVRPRLEPPAIASAMASLVGALMRAITARELEERLRALEARFPNGKVSP